MRLSRRTGHAFSEWPVILLFLLLMVPTVGILMFVMRANQLERLASRQLLLEAYRSQLRDVRARLTSRFDDLLEAARQANDTSPASRFASIVTDGMCDSVVVLDANKSALYPTVEIPPSAPITWPTNLASLWSHAEFLEFQQNSPHEAAHAYEQVVDAAVDPLLTALAYRGQLRCLLKQQRLNEGLELLVAWESNPAARNARDSDGTWPLIAAQVLWLNDAAAAGVTNDVIAKNEHIRQTLNDYRTVEFPAPQRRFLMKQWQQIDNSLAADVGAKDGSPAAARLPTLDAEELAAAWLTAEGRTPVTATLALSNVDDVWQIALSNDATTVLLIRGITLQQWFDTLLSAESSNPDVKVTLLSPSEVTASDAALMEDVGLPMRGWRIALQSDGLSATYQAEQLVTTWVVIVLAITLTIGALATIRVIRRRLQLAELQNDLVDTVAHELRTPLASMRLLTDTLRSGQLTEKQHVAEYLDMMAQENTRLTRMVENFLSFSRAKRGVSSLQLGAVDVADVVSAAVGAVGPKLYGPDCQLLIDVPPHLPCVHADRDALVAVLINLLDNAYKYSDPVRKIGVAASTCGDRIQLRVSDNGPGLTRGVQRRAFRRFYRGQRQLNQTISGCGLGLSIVKMMVDAMRGTVRIDSHAGKGATFIVELPISAAD